MQRRWWALVAVALATFMTYLETQNQVDCYNIRGHGTFETPARRRLQPRF